MCLRVEIGCLSEEKNGAPIGRYRLRSKLLIIFQCPFYLALVVVLIFSNRSDGAIKVRAFQCFGVAGSLLI